MRILYLIFSFHTGGIEKQLIELTGKVAEENNDVILCVINHSYDKSLFQELSKKVHLILFERKSGEKILSYMWKFAALVRRKRIDIIHAQEPTGVVFSIIAKIIKPSVGIIETIHDVGEYKLYTKKQIWIADRLCDYYIAISYTVQRELLGRGISQSRISIIYNGVNTDKFSISARRKKSDLLISSEKTIYLGNVARFYPAKKGQDILVRAVEILKQRGIRVHCRFAGAVYRDQEIQWEDMHRYLKGHNLEQEVEFLGNVSDVPEFLRSVDIFVLPSRFEGFGIALIEALSMGIPCVASRLDGPAEILKDPRLGVTFDPENPEDLANKIEQVAGHYQNYDPVWISKYVQEHFSLDVLTEHHLTLYQRIGKRKSRHERN